MNITCDVIVYYDGNSNLTAKRTTRELHKTIKLTSYVAVLEDVDVLQEYTLEFVRKKLARLFSLQQRDINK